MRGGVVTIDAMGTQKAIAEEVIRGQADYVLALKGNHESLHRAVIEHIGERLEGDLEGARELTTTDRGPAAVRSGPTCICRRPRTCRGSRSGRT